MARIDFSVVTSQARTALIYLLSLPLVTRCILLTCVFITIPAILWGELHRLGCMQASRVLPGFELWRLESYTVIHRNVIHLFINMVSFVPVGRKMEQLLGSTKFAYSIFVVSTLVSMLYVLITVLVSSVLEISGIYWSECVLGFSGVLFATLVIYVYNFNTKETMKVLQVVPVPQTIYPWILLFLCQLLPDMSFLAHFCGILIGYAYVGGLMSRLQLSSSTLAVIESWEFLKRTRNISGFMPNPDLTSASGLPTTVQTHKRTKSGPPVRKPNHPTGTELKPGDKASQLETIVLSSPAAAPSAAQSGTAPSS